MLDGVAAGRKQPIRVVANRGIFGPPDIQVWESGTSGMLTHEELLRGVERLAAAALGRWGLDGAALRILIDEEDEE